MNTHSHLCVLIGSVLLLAAACDEPAPGTDDAGTGGAPTCAAYCETIQANCTGANAQYTDAAECLATCQGAGWPAGDRVTGSGPASGHSIGCRTYHGGAPAVDDPVTHCVHAGETGANVCGGWCDVYCGTALAGCTGADAIYASMAECMTACGALDDRGRVGEQSGDTVQCRLYHLGVAIRSGDTALHCPHAAPDGGGVCVGGWTFRDDAPTAYTRVDRMGMPAVATALIASANKNAYNDADPSDDADGTFVAELTASVTGLHTALDDDLTGLSLVPCAPAACISQAAPLVVPDTLTLNTGMPAGFPNGRGLTDPVIDVTLAVILLDLSEPGQTAASLVGVNPDANDATFLTAFPYLAPPHAP